MKTGLPAHIDKAAGGQHSVGKFHQAGIQGSILTCRFSQIPAVNELVHGRADEDLTNGYFAEVGSGDNPVQRARLGGELQYPVKLGHEG